MMIVQSQQDVRPLQRTANSWAAAHLTRPEQSSSTINRPIKREVQGLLNKLTWSNFDAISAVLVTKVDCSEKADDGKILREVVRMILEQVTLQGDNWAEMYAKLCKKLIDQTSPELKSGNRPPDSDRDQWHTGRWFRHYLATGWKGQHDRDSHNSSSEIGADKRDGQPTKKAETPADDLYLAARIRRRRLSLFRFIGELFKVNFIIETHMHHCIKNLLRDSQTSPENIEYLRYLMINFGELLDQPNAQGFMNLYFDTITKMSQSPHLGSRALFMIQDIIDARKNKWTKRKGAADNSLGVHPTRSTPTESKQQNLGNPSASTQITCKQEEDDKSKTEEMTQKEICAVWTPTHIWTDEQQKALLEAILDQQQLELQTVNGNLSSQGWTIVTEKMKTKFGREFHFKWLKNQLNRIHKTYLDIKFLKNRFGFRWDEKNWILSADPNSWDNLIQENPKKRYPQLRNRRDPIGWYGAAQQVFNGAPSTSAQNSHFSFLNNNKDKRESISQANLGTPLIPSPSATDSIKTSLVHKRNNDTISSDDGLAIPPSSTSRAHKHPRLSSHDPAKINSYGMSKLVLDSAPTITPLQPTPAIHNEKSPLLNPPVKASPASMITSCVTERKNEMGSLDGRVDDDQHMASSSSPSQTRPQPENPSQATAEARRIDPESQPTSKAIAAVAQTDPSPAKKDQELKQPPATLNPSVEAITLLAPMFIDFLDPLQYVQFVHVLENQANAAVFLALAATTNPIICKTWLLHKSL